VPAKRALRQRRTWNTAPKEKMSQAGSRCSDLVRLTISGATYPGVPHLKKMYYSSSAWVAKPKSTMTGSRDSPRSIIFSGLMSRCMILFSCMCFNPFKSPAMRVLV